MTNHFLGGGALMGFEQSVVARRDKEFSEELQEEERASMNISRSSRKTRRRRKPVSPVQTLFNTCKQVFVNAAVGFVPPPDDIQRLRSVLDSLKSEDVGLRPDMPYFRATVNKRAPPITYLHLYECDQFSMGIFCLPPSGVLPLHNHPGMTVFSKLLFGTMHIKSYDWVDGAPSTTTLSTGTSAVSGEVRLAQLKVNANLVAPCNTSILYPVSGGNMHCFTAVTACAVLDVLGPPYSDPDGRHCAYYLEYPFDSFSVDGLSVKEEEKEELAWLQERDKPRELSVVGAFYRGPKIVVS